jgi:hypothetical protein
LLPAIFSFARVALLVLGQHVAEGLVGCGGGFSSKLGFRNARVGHDEVRKKLKKNTPEWRLWLRIGEEFDFE